MRASLSKRSRRLSLAASRGEGAEGGGFGEAGLFGLLNPYGLAGGVLEATVAAMGSGLAPGVGLGGWHPTEKNGQRRNQFDHAMKTLRNALADRDIDGDGVRDVLIPAGIIWMHGESDADKNIETAEAYEEGGGAENGGSIRVPVELLEVFLQHVVLSIFVLPGMNLADDILP